MDRQRRDQFALAWKVSRTCESTSETTISKKVLHSRGTPLVARRAPAHHPEDHQTGTPEQSGLSRLQRPET